MEERFYKKPAKPAYVVKIALHLRKNPTGTETALWHCIRKRQLLGKKFRRQAPFGRYIIDFYCPELLLGIEIDGSVHRTKKEYDEEREKFMTESGLKLLHFTNSDIYNRLDIVLDTISIALKSLQS